MRVQDPTREAFTLRILPGCPGTTGWKVSPYRQPPTRKQQAEMARQMQNAFLSMGSQLTGQYLGAGLNIWPDYSGGLGRYR